MDCCQNMDENIYFGSCSPFINLILIVVLPLHSQINLEKGAGNSFIFVLSEEAKREVRSKGMIPSSNGSVSNGKT